jgi:hypothetical protein
VSPWRRRAARRLQLDANLTSCRSCASEYVIPTAWTQHDEESWWIHVRCGECRESREIVVSDAAAQRYDAELDRGMHEIARGLDRLEREEMARDAEAFATALELDLVDADFVR